MIDYYDIAGNPISMEQWAEMFKDTKSRIIGKDRVGDAEVSTVWLGLNHAFFPDSPPLIFETMIFGGEHDQDQWRYTTKEQAEAGHREAVKMLVTEATVESE